MIPYSGQLVLKIPKTSPCLNLRLARLEATQRTLGINAYGYPAVMADLHRCPDSMVTARAVNASSWCRGCTRGRYLTGLIPTVEAHYDTYSKL